MARSSYYFIALLIPEPFTTEINTFKAQMLEQFHCKTALKSAPHITLFAPFLWNEQREYELMDALLLLKPYWKESTIQLNGFGHFGSRVIFVRPFVEPFLYAFQLRLLTTFQTTLQLKQKFHPGRTFEPHVTIANRDIPPERFEEAWALFRHKEYQATFSTQRLSLLKHDGLRWNTLFEISPHDSNEDV